MKREDTRRECILGGTYCLLRLLQQRPRLNLYLGRRERQQERKVNQGTLVAVRELLLDGLTTAEREQVEYAAFQEFVSPLLPGSTRLSAAADLQRVEGKWHYTIIHLEDISTRGRPQGSLPHILPAPAPTAQASVLTLEDLLLHKAAWPRWLDKRIALRWSIQLARLVAKLHHAGVVLGDLSPSTVLVDGRGLTSWAPLLLPSWPPPPCYWRHPTASSWRPKGSTLAPLHLSLFPPGRASTGSPFTAPETLRGESYPCSDVYSLGAILYLLLAHYAPPSALRRTMGLASPMLEWLELPSPQLFEYHHTEKLEPIIRRTLALEPDERYNTVFELVEALEGVESEM
jgi:hypothetical protein